MLDEVENIENETKTVELTKKQQEVLDKFNGFEIEKVDTTQCSLGCKGEVFDLKDAQIYRIKGQNTYVLFGEVQRSMSFDKIREMLADFQKDKNSNAMEEDEDIQEVQKEFDGDKNDKEHLDDVNQADVEMLMDKTGCTKDEAIKALKDNNMDCVSALISFDSK